MEMEFNRMEVIEEKRKNIKTMGVVMVSLQSFSFAVGIATFVLLNQSPNASRYLPVIGEQIWAPFIIIISSKALALPPCNNLNVNKVRNCMMISIFASFISLSFLIIEVFFAIIYYGKHFIAYKMLTGVIAFIALLTLVSSLMTSCYCCCLLPEFDCCYGNRSSDFLHFVATNQLNVLRTTQVNVFVTSQPEIDDPPPPYPGPPIDPPKYYE